MDGSVFELAGRQLKSTFGKLDFPEWCGEHIRLIKNGRLVPFSFEGHEYLKEIYSLPFDVKTLVFQKAAQMGISTYSLLRVLKFLDDNAAKAVYYFPTDDDVRDFAQDRCDPMIDNSEYLSKKISYDRADNLGLKQLGNSSLYFRGVFSKQKVKSVDADIIIKDEVDEADQENLVFADDRLLHSSFGYRIELSQPSSPDFGINRAFKETDQRYWIVKCPKCGRQNNIVESFPKNLFSKGKGNKISSWIGCTRCRGKLDTTKGQWVAKHPSLSNDGIGFQVSQLFSTTVSPLQIYKRFTKATLSSEKKNFWISYIGVPYQDSNLCPFTDALIEGCEERNYGFEKEAFSSFMGIDVGDVCHVVVFGWTGKRLRMLYCEEVLSDDFERFCYLIERYRSFFVIDAMPYKNLSKRLALKYKGWGAIQYFKGESLREKTEGEGEYEVPVVMHNRTESIDEMKSEFENGFFVLPNPKKLKGANLEMYERWKAHIKNLEKEETMDKAGYKKIEYKKKVENHFGMATNSAYIAFTIGRGVSMQAVDPVF